MPPPVKQFAGKFRTHPYGFPLLWKFPGQPTERFSAAGPLDLQKVVLALPGGRAGRRLLEILVAEAERLELQLCPPRMVTAGKLPELLYPGKRPFAEPLTQQLACTKAFRRGDPYLHEAIALKLPAENDLAARVSLGETLASVHWELAGDGLNFADVAQRGCRLKGFPASEIAGRRLPRSRSTTSRYSTGWAYGINVPTDPVSVER